MEDFSTENLVVKSVEKTPRMFIGLRCKTIGCFSEVIIGDKKIDIQTPLYIEITDCHEGGLKCKKCGGTEFDNPLDLPSSE